MPGAPIIIPSTTTSHTLVRPELLSPAGDWECARAAVENGADAIYFGLERFNARMRAKNFTTADLPALMTFLHRRGVKGYVTFNTLVFSDELATAEEYLRAIITAGVDAAIVQDIGICRLIRRLSPDFPIHCSTQMTITSVAGVEFARQLGAQLVVLARENSLKEIAAMQAVQKSTAVALPLEVFVHGALCVAYSGQCLTSESLGGRSANRGECAQACRMPYDLVSDGRQVPLGDRRYLLSPQDLAGIDLLPDLVRAGIASLKIEGRLKSPEYVANITRTYRGALDRVMAEAITEPTHEPSIPANVSRETRYNLEMAFSRGLYTGWFRGINNQKLAHARFGTKRGVFLGIVTQVERAHVKLTLEAPLKPGDGVVFDAGHPEEKEEGGRVYQIIPTADGSITLRFGHGDIDFSRIAPGQRIWKTSDPALERELRQTFAGERAHFRRDLHWEVHGAPGTPLTVIARDDHGHISRASSTTLLAPAERQPLTTEKLREQLGRLGGTVFQLGRLENHLEGAVILAVSELNELRRRAVNDLEAQRIAPKHWTLHTAPALPGLRPTVCDQPRSEPELIAVIRHRHQLSSAWAAGVRTIYCEFENPKHYREAVTDFRELRAAVGLTAHDATLWVAAPRVFKPGEEWILQQVLSCEADGYLVRNYDHLTAFAGHRRRGDFSLNVANELTAAYFIREHGLERVTASYDLNVEQLTALLQGAPPAWFDITLHQHMPMFHMEHCVFCAFLSTGRDYRDCGRPCDRHDVRLRDRIGAEHPLKADAGCRNTVYNARAQTGAEFATEFLRLGVRSFRIEFLNESAEEVTRILGRYRQLLRGEIGGAELWREFKFINQLGVTRGQLDSPARVLQRK